MDELRDLGRIVELLRGATDRSKADDALLECLERLMATRSEAERERLKLHMVWLARQVLPGLIEKNQKIQAEIREIKAEIEELRSRRGVSDEE